MTTTNFIDGVTNVYESTALGTYVAPDPTKVHQFMDDFDSYNAQLTTTPGLWLPTITEGGAGDATATITDEDGGVLLVTNDDADNDAYYAQWKGWNTNVAETFTWASDKALWFKVRAKVSDATNSALIFGLAVTDTSPLDAADALVLTKADGSTSLTFKAIKTGAGTTTATVGTIASATYFTAAFCYLPKGDATGTGVPTCNLYLNDVLVGQVTTFTNFPTTELAVTFGVVNGSAGAKTLSLDYILASKQRD